MPGSAAKSRVDKTLVEAFRYRNEQSWIRAEDSPAKSSELWCTQ